MRGYDGQVRHAYVFVVSFLDHRHLAHLLAIYPRVGGKRAQEVVIDGVDDLHVARQHPLHQRDAPLFQRFRQQRVIGVGDRLLRDCPGVFPLQIVFIHQHAHQFGNRQRGMGVIHLDGDLIREGRKIIVCRKKVAGDVAHRAGDQEVFLHQAQFLAGHRRIAGIQHARDVFAADLLFDGANVVAAVEDFDVEIVGRARLEEAQVVDRVAVVANHWHVARYADHHLVIQPALAVVAAVARIFNPAVEGNDDGLFGTRNLHRGSVGLPAVRLLALKAV